MNRRVLLLPFLAFCIPRPLYTTGHFIGLSVFPNRHCTLSAMDRDSSALFSLIKHSQELANSAFEDRRYDSARSFFATALQSVEATFTTSAKSSLRDALCPSLALSLKGHLQSNLSTCKLIGYTAAAVDDAIACTRICPQWSKVWYRLGLTLLVHGEPSAAATAFAQGYKVNVSAVAPQQWLQDGSVVVSHSDEYDHSCENSNDDKRSFLRDGLVSQYSTSIRSSSDAQSVCPSRFASQMLDHRPGTTIIETVEELHELVVRKQQNTIAFESQGRCASSKQVLRFIDEVVWAHQSERPGDFSSEALMLSLTWVAKYLEQASAIQAPRVAAERRNVTDDVRRALNAVLDVVGEHLLEATVRGAWLFLGTSDIPLLASEKLNEVVFPAACIVKWAHDSVSRLVEYSMLRNWKRCTTAMLCLVCRLPNGMHELKQLLCSRTDKLYKIDQNSAKECSCPQSAATVVMIDPGVLEDGLMGMGLVRHVRFLRRRLCTPHTLVLPFQVILMIAPCSIAIPETAYPEDSTGIATAFHDLCWSPSCETIHVDATLQSVTLLARPKPCFMFNFLSVDVEIGLPVRMSSDIEFDAINAGSLNAIIFWYDLSFLPMRLAVRNRHLSRPVVNRLSNEPLVWRLHASNCADPNSIESSIDGNMERRGLFFPKQALQWVDRISLMIGQRIIVQASHTSTRAIFRVKIPVSMTPEHHVTAVPRWHLSLVADATRTARYRAGIKEAVAAIKHAAIDKECTVLILGAGSGLQSFFAARAGAGRVIGIDHDVSLLGIAHRLARNLQESHNVCFVHGNMCDVHIGVHFLRRFDVLLLEKIDFGLVGTGALALVHLAWTHFLKPSGIVLPRCGRVYACCVDLGGAGAGLSNHWRSYECETKYTKKNLNCASRRLKRLSQPFEVFDFDFSDRNVMLDVDALTGIWERGVAVIREGHLSAVCFWFELDFGKSGDYCMSTSPNATATSSWPQACQAVDGPFVRPGDRVELRAYHEGWNVTFAACCPSHQAIRIARPMFDGHWLRLQSMFIENDRDFATAVSMGTTRRQLAQTATALCLDTARFAWSGTYLGYQGNDVVTALFSVR